MDVRRPYVVAQVVAATAAGAVLLAITSCGPGFRARGGFASNGYGDRSPGGYGARWALIAAIVPHRLLPLRPGHRRGPTRS